MGLLGKKWGHGLKWLPEPWLAGRVPGVAGDPATLPPLKGSLSQASEGLCWFERGVAQLGSAGALGALGRRFESCRPDLSHSKGSRGSGSPSFLAFFGRLSTK